VVYRDDDQVTIKMKTPASEVWCHVTSFNAGYSYQVEIIEKALSSAPAR